MHRQLLLKVKTKSFQDEKNSSLGSEFLISPLISQVQAQLLQQKDPLGQWLTQVEAWFSLSGQIRVASCAP